MAEQNLRIEDLLGSLRSEGHLDSEGVFTLDEQAAVQKLSRFQLEDVNGYLLKILQAAVASGASSCTLRIGLSEIDCTFEGAAFDVHKLGTIPGELLAREVADPARFHLAVALNGAISSVISEIQLAAFDGKEGRKVIWRSGSSQTSEWSPPNGRRQMSLKFERNQDSRWAAVKGFFGERDAFGMLWGFESGWTPEEKLIHAKFDAAPLNIQLNRTWVRRGKKTFEEYYQGKATSRWSMPVSSWFQDRFERELVFPVLGKDGAVSPRIQVGWHCGQVYRAQVPKRLAPNLTNRQDLGYSYSSDDETTICGLYVGALVENKSMFSKSSKMRLILLDDGLAILDELYPVTRGGGGVVISSARGLTKDLSTLKLVDNSLLDRRIMDCEDVLSLVCQNKVEEAVQAGLKLLESIG